MRTVPLWSWVHGSGFEPAADREVEGQLRLKFTAWAAS